MLGDRQLSIDDYVAILRRRLWVIVIPAILGPVIGYAVSLALPERYTSQTLVLIEQQKVPDSYVRSVVTEQLHERLATMSEQILSRTRLQPIIERFGLYKGDEGRAPMEELVARMRKSIALTPVRPTAGAKPGGGVPGFYVAFSTDNPRVAQQVCAELTSMFMEENLRRREQRAQGTTDFLQKQLEEAKRKLDEQDARLAAFKGRHIGQLPGQEQTNLNILMGLNTQLEAVTQLLSRTQQDKAYTESLLAQQIQAWESSQAGSNPQTLEQQLASLQNQLITLEARYTSDHPDVIKMKSDIAQLKKKLDEASTANKDAAVEKTQKAARAQPPPIQQMRNQIYQFEQNIREKTRDQERLQQQIKLYQARVQLSPLVEQQYKEITRDYQTALDFYNDMLAKRTQSEMATDLERRQQAEQFRVMDPANLPETPSFPDRPLFAAGGLGGGLILGLGIAVLLEARDKSLHTERDIEFYLQLPALALVPTFSDGHDKKDGFKKHFRKKDAGSRQKVEA